jgi:small subunit ribosomal protein S16
MLKLRLKRIGRKRSPAYRLVVMESLARREGRPVEEVGYYDPISKKSKFEVEKNSKMVKTWSKTNRSSVKFIEKS